MGPKEILCFVTCYYISKTETKKKPGEKCNRKFTYSYMIKSNGDYIFVCKLMFLKTFGLKRVYKATTI